MTEETAHDRRVSAEELARLRRQVAPNYRGSTGRGREFKNRIHGDWGGMEQADVAAGGR